MLINVCNITLGIFIVIFIIWNIAFGVEAECNTVNNKEINIWITGNIFLLSVIIVAIYITKYHMVG